MRVRIRLQYGPRVPRERDLSRRAALAAASLLSPASVMAAVAAGWALAVARGWSERFFVSGGLLADWRPWVAVALLLRAAGILLDRYGRSWRPPKPPILDLGAEDPIRRDLGPPDEPREARARTEEIGRPYRDAGRGSAVIP
jgi:hypothetical protein